MYGITNILLKGHDDPGSYQNQDGVELIARCTAQHNIIGCRRSGLHPRYLNAAGSPGLAGIGFLEFVPSNYSISFYEIPSSGTESRLEAVDWFLVQ